MDNHKLNIYRICFIVLDFFMLNLCLLASLALRFDTTIPHKYFTLYMHTIPVLTILSLGSFAIFGLYHSLWRYAGIDELIKLALACMMTTICLCLFNILTNHLFPRTVYLIYLLTSIAYSTISRLSYRFCRRIKNSLLRRQKTDDTAHRIMLIGAGDAALHIINEFHKNANSLGEIVALIDDAPSKQNCKIAGIPIVGSTDTILEAEKRYHITQIILAIPSASKSRIAEILKICSQGTSEILIFPGVPQSIQKDFTLNQIRPVQIEDLLGRDEIILDNNLLLNHLQHKVVLVTGGGGSIGSELCRQIVSYSPKRLIIFDIYENNAYDLQNELLRHGYPAEKLNVLIGSVRDMPKLKEVFQTYNPNIVFHAAAHKHVPLMEDSPAEAIKNNIFGTYNVAECANLYKAERFILISTDKAVNPTNVMGATKRFCEMIVQSMNQVSTHTDFAAVRFGNVLGSNGSVIPLFKRQLEAGGPLTVTHPDITRFFMTIPEAVRLILQAMTFAKGGEIFVLDMGERVKIMDLAKNYIRLSGLKLDEDISIKITGLRPGEKLYEELLMDEEGLTNTSCNKVFIGKPLDLNYKDVMFRLNYIQKALYDHIDVRTILQNVVPTYKPASTLSQSKLAHDLSDSLDINASLSHLSDSQLEQSANL